MNNYHEPPQTTSVRLVHRRLGDAAPASSDNVVAMADHSPQARAARDKFREELVGSLLWEKDEAEPVHSFDYDPLSYGVRPVNFDPWTAGLARPAPMPARPARDRYDPVGYLQR